MGAGYRLSPKPLFHHSKWFVARTNSLLIKLYSGSTNQISSYVLEDMDYRNRERRRRMREPNFQAWTSGVHFVRKAESEIDGGDLVGIR